MNITKPFTSKSSKFELEALSSDIDNFVNDFGSSSISGGNKFDEEFLRAHNEYRKYHGAQPLELNKKLCKLAEDWATTLAKKGKTAHKDQNEYGENIFSAWSTDPNFTVTGRDPVDQWYSEVNNYKFGKENSDLTSGHFSQVVWEDTKELGVGVAKSEEGHVYVVAYYNPKRN